MLTIFAFSFGLALGVVIGLVWAMVSIDRPRTEPADPINARFKDWK